jgi:hypothetical protein
VRRALALAFASPVTTSTSAGIQMYWATACGYLGVTTMRSFLRHRSVYVVVVDAKIAFLSMQ